MMKKDNLPSSCPCGSGQKFDQCCGPYHQGKPAPSARVLMRSRFSAFALANHQYLLETTLPAQQSQAAGQKLYSDNANTQWARLEIIDTVSGGPEDTTGIVEFKAWFRDCTSGIERAHHERSDFIKEHNHWYFIYPDLKGSVGTRTGRNDPCPCGSNKKYKKCCGK